ncbi:MAG: hypothetical protein AAB362_01290 [Patescibacteria group bacterium]
MKSTAEIFALLVIFLVVIGGAMFFSGKKLNFFSFPALSGPQGGVNVFAPAIQSPPPSQPPQSSPPLQPPKISEKNSQTSPQELVKKADLLRSLYEGKIFVQLYNYSNKASDEYFTIQNTGTSSIQITGWTVENQRGVGAKIPKVEVIPRSDGYEEDIRLPPFGMAYVHTGARDGGGGFRENACSSYLSELEVFVPPLSYSCFQSPSIEELYNRGFNSACITFIRSQSMCRAVNTVLYPTSVEIGSACNEYVQANLNYAGCVRVHRGEKDFFKDRWHVFFKRTEKLFDSAYNELIIKDERGLTIIRKKSSY